MKHNQKAGRPTIMTTETIKKLRQAFLMGLSDREACLYADIGLQTLYDYQKSNSEFSEQKRQYKKNPVLKAKTTVYKSLDQVKVAQWYLERKARKEFSIKKESQKQEYRPLLPTRMEELETDYGKLADELVASL